MTRLIWVRFFSAEPSRAPATGILYAEDVPFPRVPALLSLSFCQFTMQSHSSSQHTAARHRQPKRVPVIQSGRIRPFAARFNTTKSVPWIFQNVLGVYTNHPQFDHLKMRLINVSTLKLQSYYDFYILPYAILSHTRGRNDEKVTFQNIETLPTASSRWSKTSGKLKKLCDQ